MDGPAPKHADYFIQAFAGPRHPKISEGEFVISTWHVGQSSRDMEIETFRIRGRRGDIGRIIITARADLNEPPREIVFTSEV